MTGNVDLSKLGGISYSLGSDVKKEDSKQIEETLGQIDMIKGITPEQREALKEAVRNKEIIFEQGLSLEEAGNLKENECAMIMGLSKQHIKETADKNERSIKTIESKLNATNKTIKRNKRYGQVAAVTLDPLELQRKKLQAKLDYLIENKDKSGEDYDKMLKEQEANMVKQNGDEQIIDDGDEQFSGNGKPDVSDGATELDKFKSANPDATDEDFAAFNEFQKIEGNEDKTFADYKADLQVKADAEKLKQQRVAEAKTEAQRYVVQSGDQIDKIVAKSLGGDVDRNSEQFKNAKAEFMNNENNKGAFMKATNGSGDTWLRAGKTVQLPGEVDLKKAETYKDTAAKVDADFRESKYYWTTQTPAPDLDVTPPSVMLTHADAYGRAERIYDASWGVGTDEAKFFEAVASNDYDADTRKLKFLEPEQLRQVDDMLRQDSDFSHWRNGGRQGGLAEYVNSEFSWKDPNASPLDQKAYQLMMVLQDNKIGTAEQYIIE
ncbi:MAG: hypothetical protein R3Y28_04595 [Candidatus Gastranaerophilales bacterium]